MDAMLTCEALLDFLDDYVEGRLTSPGRECFEEHLARCPDCVSYLNGYRGTMRVLTLIGQESVDILEDAPRGLVEAILAARRTALA